MSNLGRTLSRPSTVALIILCVAIVAMTLVAIFGQTNSESFFNVMSDLVKIIGGGWAGATFGEKYSGGGASNE